MDEAGSGVSRRTSGHSAFCVIALWLGLLGVQSGCGDGDGRSDAQQREDRSADQSTQAEQDEESTTTTAPTASTTTAPRVVYEIDGTGTVAVNYSLSGDRNQSREVTLPWSEEQAEEPSRLSMLVALAGSQGDVTCRIRRGAEVLAEATLSATEGPLLGCDYPPSGLPPVTYPPTP